MNTKHAKSTVMTIVGLIGVFTLLAAGLVTDGTLAPQQARAATSPRITTVWIASVTQTQAVIYFETDQPTAGYVDYGLTTNLGRVRPLSAPAASLTHTITLPSLKADTRYYWRVRASNGNGTVQGDDAWFRTPSASATAKLTVTTKNTSGSTLLGSCFVVATDAGGGALGNLVDEYCDKYDSSPNDAKIVFPALNPGAYVLLETRSPDGYSLAKSVPFTAAAGQSIALTVTNTHGGARVTIDKRDEQDQPVPGACFEVSQIVNGNIGAFVADNCDDYDGADGITTLGNLKPGSYWLSEWQTPAGHLTDDGKVITIASGERSLAVTFVNPTTKAGDNVELDAIDSNKVLLPGACFVLFSDGETRSACDGDDGELDGRSYLTNVIPGVYTVIEYHAPAGYLSGKQSTLTKIDDQFKRLRLTQVAGGVRVTVKTLKGSGSTLLPGACYQLFRKSTTGPWPNYGSWCDSSDGANDGVTRLDGIKPGTYALSQFHSPAGYTKPDDLVITVGSKGTTISVHTAKGASAQEAGGLLPSLAAPAMTARSAEQSSAASTPKPKASATPRSTATSASTPVATVSASPTDVPTEIPAEVATETPTPEPSPTAEPNASPVAVAGEDQTVTDADANGTEPFTLDGSASSDPEGSSLSFQWTIDGAVVAESAIASVDLTIGTHEAVLTVTDDQGSTASDSLSITVDAVEPTAEATTTG